MQLAKNAQFNLITWKTCHGMPFHMRSIDSRIRLGSPATSIACKAIDKFQSTIERNERNEACCFVNSPD